MLFLHKFICFRKGASATDLGLKKKSCLWQRFKLSFEIHFALNTPSVARLLPFAGEFFLKNCKAFFAFCDVILVISNTSFDNSMQWMNKMWL